MKTRIKKYKCLMVDEKVSNCLECCKEQFEICKEIFENNQKCKEVE